MTKMYDLMEALGEGDIKKYLKNDVSETYEHLKIASGFVIGGLKEAGKIALKGAYPIVGNFSNVVQEKLEETLGEKVYNSRIATTISAVTNVVSYPAVIGVMGDIYAFDASASVVLSMVYGIAEIVFRGSGTNKASNIFDEACASVPGKIASLPLEAMIGFYDGLKSREK